MSVRMDGSKNSQSLGSGDVHNLETVVVRGVSCVGNQEEGGKSSAGQNHGDRCIQAYVNKRERERQTDKHPSIHPSQLTRNPVNSFGSSKSSQPKEGPGSLSWAAAKKHKHKRKRNPKLKLASPFDTHHRPPLYL